MKNAAVATTAARGAAVSNSRITAVQSVYMEAEAWRLHHDQPTVAFRRLRRWTWISSYPALAPMPPRHRSISTVGSQLPTPMAALIRGCRPVAVVLAVLVSGPALAGVRFENCQSAPDGSISCDTVPTGNTLMQDVDARFGLLDNASPGWAEFDPYAGFEDDFGGNQT